MDNEIKQLIALIVGVVFLAGILTIGISNYMLSVRKAAFEKGYEQVTVQGYPPVWQKVE